MQTCTISHKQPKDELEEYDNVPSSGEENGNINMEGLVDYMSTLVPGMSLSDRVEEDANQPPLPPKQKTRNDNANLEVNGRHSDDEQKPSVETAPVVPPRRKDHRKQTPLVSIFKLFTRNLMSFCAFWTLVLRFPLQSKACLIFTIQV